MEKGIKKVSDQDKVKDLLFWEGLRQKDENPECSPMITMEEPSQSKRNKSNLANQSQNPKDKNSKATKKINPRSLNLIRSKKWGIKQKF